MTKPVEDSKLRSFYKRVQPGGIGWKSFAKQMPEVKPDGGYKYLFVDWICGVVLVYSFLFGFGKIIFGEYLLGFGLIILGLAAGAYIFYDLNKRGWEKLN